MATKPSSLPEWATAGAVVEPLLAEKQLGWVAGSRGPAQWFNWWMRLVYQWMVWLDAFESDPHTWTALQTFSQRISSIHSSSTSAAVFGQNTNAGAGVGLEGDSSNGVGVAGSGKIYGVLGSQTGLFTNGAGVRGIASDPLAFGGLFEHLLEGVALKVSTSGSIGTPGSALQVFPGGTARGIEVNGASNIAVDVVTTASGVGTNSIRTLGGRTGILGRPTAGATNGVGVRGEGQTTGAGVEGVGGSTAGAGVTGAGGTNGPGMRANGNGTGQGIVAVGGTGASGVGGEFGRGDADHTKPAINCVGAVALIASADVAGTTAILNELHRKMVIRAWAFVELNNTATPTVIDRVNMATVAQQVAGNGIVTFTMAQAMANSSYAVIREVDPGISNLRGARVSVTNSTTFVVEIYDPSAPSTVLTAASSNGYRVFVAVLGAQ